MLKTITLKNFRRHRELSVAFGAGMTVIRALNEQGKSTLLEAVSYALFGVKALRDSLDDVVTWGEATNTLRVELEVEIEGVTYIVKRGKSGAEVTYDGGSVTGQNEVTGFAARLLKVDAAAASRLTMSNQNEIRGALEAGTKATTELIERLAEFSQIDDLIELIQEKLPLGSTAAAEANLAQLERDLEDAQAKAQQPDTASLEAAIDGMRLKVEKARAKVGVAEEAYTQAQAAFDKGQEAHSARARLVDRLESAQRARDRFNEELQAATVAANSITLFPFKVEEVKAEVEQLKDAPRLLAHFKRVEHMLAPVSGPVTDMSLEALQEAITGFTEQADRARRAAATARETVARATAQLSHGTCSFCGQDFSDLPEVARKNAELQAEIDAAKEAITSNGATEAAAKLSLTSHQAILTASAVLKQPLPEFIERDGHHLPPSFKWVGPDVATLQDSKRRLDELNAQLNEVEAARKREDLALARLRDLQARRDEVYGAVGAATHALDEVDEVDTESLREARQAARAAALAAQNELSDAQAELRDAERRVETMVSQWRSALERVEQVQNYITQRKREIESMAFNNALLKKVRSARPVIADKLWNIVLTAVSGYFSEIRGEKSRVAKDGDGFKVDGHPVTSLSGSTKDALGLAIRVALVRTFLPSSPFLILDEPAAAMDDQRTENLLGFISTCGFQQVLLVTHENVSETLADHIITL